MSRPLGLYVHVPFCRQKCVYCDFYSLPRREGEMDAYVSALRAQLAGTDFSGYEADTVYLGGGTPSYLGPRRLTALLESLRGACPVLPGAEITLEANPDSAHDPEGLAALRQAGFNRVSLGMQSADDGELRALGRVHTAAQVRASVEALRKAGFENLSLDLIYGLPLKAEEGTPLYALRDTLPGDEVQADMYLETVDFLESRGYRQYEISNFAKPGRESRHNLKYWTLAEYAGFGPGAHSDFRGTRYAWARDLASFLRGEAERSEFQVMTAREREAEWLMLALRTVRGLDSGEYAERFGASFQDFLPFLRRCEAAGYALRTGERWRLTPRGFLVSNPIIGELLSVRDGI